MMVKLNRHVPVLLSEVISNLDLEPGMAVVDATLGNAGHAEVLIDQIDPGGKFYGFDADPLAIEESRKILSEKKSVSINLYNSNFTEIRKVLNQDGVKQLDVALFDLGLRRGSLEDTGRGFSFQRGDEPLDMRFDPSSDLPTAAEIINTYPEAELSDIFYHYGDERLANRYARAIISRRQEQGIYLVKDLVAVIDSSTPASKSRPGKSNATRVFQALRMAVNKELEAVEKALAEVIEIIRPGGKIAVITFHSIEDRLVKNYFKDLSKQNLIVQTPKKPIKPSREEIKNNPLSRSATLRVVTKL